VLFGRWFPHPDGSQRQNVSGGLFYLEVDVAATPIYPRGVKMHVALFQTLFGSALGRRLQAWCIQRGWALVWALGPPGGAGFPDPHDPAFALEDQRIVDATVATKIANLHPRAVVDAANLAPFEALWERVSKVLLCFCRCDCCRDHCCCACVCTYSCSAADRLLCPTVAAGASERRVQLLTGEDQRHVLAAAVLIARAVPLGRRQAPPLAADLAGSAVRRRYAWPRGSDRRLRQPRQHQQGALCELRDADGRVR